MCAIYGFVNYKNLVSGEKLKQLVKSLSVRSEERGTDASGIAYVRDGEIVIYKKPGPAHDNDFYFPPDTKILTGHNRMTTHGNAEFNCNNHPFEGKTADGHFALCHNGILYNYSYVKMAEKLPETKIETDTYVAVQLIEKYGSLNFSTVAQMCEILEELFLFTILGDDNSLYIAKGGNPICLLHFERLGLYLYTSTGSIMKEVLKGSFLEKEPFTQIDVEDGDIFRIDSNGIIEKSYFDFQKGYRGYSRYSFGDYDYELNEQLYQAAEMWGVSREEVDMLFELGYDEDEISIMIYDAEFVQECLEEARMYLGEYAFVDECC